MNLVTLLFQGTNIHLYNVVTKSIVKLRRGLDKANIYWSVNVAVRLCFIIIVVVQLSKTVLCYLLKILFFIYSYLIRLKIFYPNQTLPTLFFYKTFVYNCYGSFFSTNGKRVQLLSMHQSIILSQHQFTIPQSSQQITYC